tara:strand:+ start:6573 stop:7295 length:723 start_codon:yes stop_codon:yes gene_type:complete
MSKLDKSNYTKKQIKTLLAERRSQKALAQLTSQQLPLKTLNQHTNSEYGFVIGNGTSRKGIDLSNLKPYGNVYACNAVYREFEPDYLVAVDVKMINEIEKTGWQHTHEVWTNQNKAYRSYEGFKYFSPNKGWSSGPTALWMATQHHYTKIFILGFDYAGLDNGKGVNNMYAGTPNYKKTTDGATYYGNWEKQTANVIKENSKIVFYRVILPDNIIPQQLNKFNNLKHIYVEDFKKMFDLL